MAQRRQTHPGVPSPPLPAGKFPLVITGAAGGPRKASAMLIRLITGHAFIGSYTARFHPRKPTHCPGCGTNPQMVDHVIQQCPRYARARATYLAPVVPDLSLSSLRGTKEGGEALIKFLEVIKACFSPNEQAFDPG